MINPIECLENQVIYKNKFIAAEELNLPIKDSAKRIRETASTYDINTGKSKGTCGLHFRYRTEYE